MTFGERVKELRASRGITQEKLAADLDIPESTIRRLETSEGMPRKERIDMIASYFGVSVDYLMGRTDIPEKVLSNDARRIIDSLDLSDEEIMRTLKLEVDGIQLTPEQVMQFINYVRVERAMKKPAPVSEKGTT